MVWYRFVMERSLKDHYKKHHGDPDEVGRFECAICGEILKTQRIFHQHMKGTLHLLVSYFT